MEGIGSMLHYLSGGSEIDPKDLYGKIIKKAYFDNMNDKVFLEFEDLTVSIWDDGQTCCEERYITMDDDPSILIGHKLVEIKTKKGPECHGEGYEIHEQVFIEIQTQKSFITFCTHNKHNGYYGGFGLTITKEGTCQQKKI